MIRDEADRIAENKSDVIGGFNTFIGGQKQIKDDAATFYLVKFGTFPNIMRNDVPINKSSSFDASYIQYIQ